MARRNAVKKGKRPKQRRIKRSWLGQITYWQALPLVGGGKVKFIKRMFPSYTDAVTHLTNIKLGLDQETAPWCNYTPYKLVEFYRQGGKKYVVSTKILSEPKLKVSTNERSSMGRILPGGGLIRQRAGAIVSSPQVGKSATWYQRMWPISGGGGTSSGMCPTVTVGTRWIENFDISQSNTWDTITMCV